MTKIWLNKIIDHAASNPQSMAVVADDGALSYGELVLYAQDVALVLTNCGVKALAQKPCVVAIFGSRETSLLAAMLGVMLSGQAYAIVEDEGNLEEHLNRLRDMAPDIVLCSSHRLSSVRKAGLQAVAIPFHSGQAQSMTLKPLVRPDAGNERAYVLYTSGSTGKPKGVAITHNNIDHYTEGLNQKLDLPAGLHYAHVSTLAADLGNTSLFLALWTGGVLHLVSATLRKDPGALCAYLVENRIDVLKITPSHWRAVMAARGDRSLRLHCLLLGGEALALSLAEQIITSGITERLVNHYGPTETTVGVTIYPVEDLAKMRAMNVDLIPIGSPFGDTILRIRDETGAFMDHGVGELFIGGPSVAQGYVGRPDLTDLAFVTLPGHGALRFYKSGDLVRLDGQGIVHFQGRVDRQVKVNGYRVELEHVEAALRSLPQVAEAVVLFPEIQGKKRLVAVLVPDIKMDDIDPWLDGVRHAFRKIVPDYMQPQRWFARDSLIRNANGKSDLKEIAAWVEAQLADQSSTSMHPEHADTATKGDGNYADDYLILVRRLFTERLQIRMVGDSDNFFDLGGDSLDAIQVIAELQAGGHHISTQAFVDDPTIMGVVANLNGTREVGKRILSSHSKDGSHANTFSDAQNCFLRQCWADSDHYNQAILLESNEGIDPDILGAALRELVRNHPLLRTAFHGVGTLTAQAELMPAETWNGFAVSHPGDSLDQQRANNFVEHVAMRVQSAVRLETGDVFKVHLFKFGGVSERLLIVAHHLVVDMISWHVLVFELSRIYADLIEVGTTRLAPCVVSFWDWVDHLNYVQPQIRERAQAWLEKVEPRGGWKAVALSEGNTERNARTLWLGFDKKETKRIFDDVAAREAIGMHQLLLGVFVYAYAQQQKCNHVDVEVESHGRLVLDRDFDISRVVGWHTSTYPLRIKDLDRDLQTALLSCRDALCQVPDLGSVFQQVSQLDHPLPWANICYNYLGDIDFNHDDRVTWKASAGSLARTRGDHNHRFHDIKLSARCIHGKLVIDLSFPGKSDFNAMVAIMQTMKDTLLRLCEGTSSAARLIMESGTRTGSLTYVPAALANDSGMEGQRIYRAVLLTGATGYMGIHVLHELLDQFDGQIYCLVRAKDGLTAVERLLDNWKWYFSEDIDANLWSRIAVVEGDVTAERFGLSEQDYEDLAMRTDAIYHFAADTRLFGPAKDFQRANVQPVQSCIDMAMYKRRKDFHYMSTLAVCGVNISPEERDFSEDDLSYGQEFQNGYEKSKHTAECLVKSFGASGGRAFIYRSGNVSGHSVTGRFQRNASNNRLVQLLVACTKLGCRPQDLGEPIVLSPVDEVAAGLVAVSLDPSNSAGVFHVDGMQTIPMEAIFVALQQVGLTLTESPLANFSELFKAYSKVADADIRLGQFWASRRSRRVRFRNERTHRLMKRQGREFSILDSAWLERFVAGLKEQGVFNAVLPQSHMTIPREIIKNIH